jgi:hypothetical protein
VLSKVSQTADGLLVKTMYDGGNQVSTGTTAPAEKATTARRKTRSGEGAQRGASSGEGIGPRTPGAPALFARSSAA